MRSSVFGRAPAAPSLSHHGPVRGREDTARLWRRAQRRFRPFTVMIPIEPGSAQEALGAQLPWLAAMRMIGDRATAYVCRGFVCAAPLTDPEALS